MLVEFSVANFRSVVGRQTLSLVAGSSRSVKNRFSFESGNPGAPRLLNTAAVLGPNGAGKSTLVRALRLMRSIVVSSAQETQEGEEIDVQPFLFNKETKKNPSFFEVIFIENEARYQYGFTATRKQVISEWLFVTPRGGRAQRWIDREYSSELGAYKTYLNPTLKGEKEVWKKSTRDNALLLSVAIQLKAEPFQDAFSWFKDRLRVLESSQRLASDYSADLCKGEDKQRVIGFLKSVDLDIVDVEVQESERMNFLRFPKAIREAFVKEFGPKIEKITISEVALGHVTDEDEVVFLPLSEESDGTRVLFSLAGPWLDVLDNGLVLVVDELNNSLHSLALELLIKFFQNPEINNNNAQIIFTTHDVHVLQRDIVHRDGVWFVSLKAAEGTSLVALSEYKPRTGEAFDRGYLGGRYGAIPRIRSRIPKPPAGSSEA